MSHDLVLIANLAIGIVPTKREGRGTIDTLDRTGKESTNDVQVAVVFLYEVFLFPPSSMFIAGRPAGVLRHPGLGNTPEKSSRNS